MRAGGFAMLVSMAMAFGDFAFAESVSDYARIFQSTFKSTSVAGNSTGWLSNECSVSFNFDSVKKQMIVSLYETQLSGFMVAGLSLYITDDPNKLIFGRYRVLETKLLENSDKRLLIMSKFADADGSRVLRQRFSFDKLKNSITLELERNGRYECQLNSR